MLTDNEVAQLLLRITQGTISANEISALVVDYFQLRQELQCTASELAQAEKRERELLKRQQETVYRRDVVERLALQRANQEGQ